MKLGIRNGELLPATEARLPGGDMLIGRNGELQGYDKRDLQKTIATLLSMVQNSQVQAEPANQNEAKERRELLIASYEDRTSGKWAALGSSISQHVKLAGEREGFMRRLLVKAPLEQGNFPRIRTVDKKVTAVTMGTHSQLMPQFVTDDYIFPPEFTIAANIRVTNKEMNQGSGDILEEKYYEAQEAIMVQEDLYWKQLADATVGMDHQLKILVGGLTPMAFSEMRTDMSRWTVPAITCVIAHDYWNDIIAAPQFSNWFDPVSKYEIIQTGLLGSLLGVSFITDGFRHKQHRVLETGDFYMVGSPEMHGGYTDRGPVQSTELNNFPDGQPARGWHMYEDLSMAIVNPRSVVKAKRA